MRMTYTHRATVRVCNEKNEGLMDVDAEITGTIECDDGEWFHNGASDVKLKFYDGRYKTILGDAATAVYRSFCREWAAADLAELQAA